MVAQPCKSVRRTAAGYVICVLLILAPFELIGVSRAPRFDFICYWTSAHLLAQGHNPYDRSAIFHLEHVVGNHEPTPFIMRNPPWALPLIAPLGHCSVHVGAALWAALMLLLAAVSVLLLTRDRPQARLRAALFVPLLVALMDGQLATVILFAAALFLTFRESRPTLAGLALSLAVVKPQLLLFVWPVLLVDCLRRRDWRLPSGFLLGLALLTGLSLWLDPQAWLQYRYAMLHEPLRTQYLPNLSADLRFYLFPRSPWIQAIPSILGIVGALWYSFRSRWNWLEGGALLIAASVLLSPYCWLYDVALMLPAILRTRSTKAAEDLFLLCSLITLVSVFAVHSWSSTLLSFVALLWTAWLYTARRLAQPAAAAQTVAENDPLLPA